MASASTFLLFPLLLALALTLSPSAAARHKGGCRQPLIHIINGVADPKPNRITGNIKTEGFAPLASAPFELNRTQEYVLPVEFKQYVYYGMSMFGLRFTSFHAYEPAREKGKADIYWKANEEGFHVSYDNRKWKLVALWETE